MYYHNYWRALIAYFMAKYEWVTCSDIVKICFFSNCVNLKEVMLNLSISC